MNVNLQQAIDNVRKLQGLMYAYSEAFTGSGPIENLDVLDYAENSFATLMDLTEVIRCDLDRLVSDETLCEALGVFDD